MKKNCICLSCKNLIEDLIPKGKLKCLFQIETDETIDGVLLNGETDKCPYDFYEKKIGIPIFAAAHIAAPEA